MPITSAMLCYVMLNMTGQTGRVFLVTTRLLFCAKNASGQENFRACLSRIAICIRSFSGN